MAKLRMAHASRLGQNCPLSVKKVDIPKLSKWYTTRAIKGYFVSVPEKHPVVMPKYEGGGGFLLREYPRTEAKDREREKKTESW